MISAPSAAHFGEKEREVGWEKKIRYNFIALSRFSRLEPPVFFCPETFYTT